MSTHCFTPVLGKRLRVTVLDACGNVPAPGTVDAWLATDGFITANLTSDIADGAEIITKKADGSLCVNEKLMSSFKRFNLDMEFCGVNPSLLAMMSNVMPYVDYDADIAGFTIAEGTIDKKFAFELWTGLSGAACASGAEVAGGYLLLPFVQAGVLGDIAISGDKEVSFSLKGAHTRGGNAWGVGPYSVLSDGSSPSPLPLALDPSDHLLLMDTGLAPPPSACDPQAMQPAITLIAPATGVAAGGTSVTLTGIGFTGATSVTFGGVAGTSFTVVSDTSITVTTAAHAAGLVNVVVVNATRGNTTRTGGFTFT